MSVVPASELPPSKTCPEFGQPTHRVKCGACADARRARDQWDIDQAAARAAAISGCPWCDEEGWLLGPDGTVAEPAERCTKHEPHQHQEAVNA